MAEFGMGRTLPFVNPKVSQSTVVSNKMWCERMIRVRKLLVISVVGLVFASPAAATTYRWTPTKAQNRVKAVYRTPDTVSPRAPDAKVEKAVCTGVGKPVNHRYAKFKCAVTMIGWGEYSQDGFHPTQHLVVRVTGALTFNWSLSG